MMDLNLYIAFFAATTIMILLPGPSVMLTVAHSISFGWRRALATVTGATIGVGIQLAITLVGMTSLMVLMAEWFEWLRWAGVAYLAYLGIQQWRAQPESGPESGPEETTAPAVRSGRSLLIQGVVVTTANPKSMFFLAAFFPQFIDPVAAPGPQFALLGVTFLAITFGFTALWAVAASHAGGAFRTRRGVRLRNRIAGSLMLGAGLGLALVRRS
jgi:threonine/homoserine/homoserine lactone efflux protein